MEVLGLTMIIVLFIIGIGLLVFFGRPKGASFTAEYNQKLAGSFVTIIPDVKIRCSGYDVRMAEYIRACATSAAIACAGDHDQTCGALKGALETALANSLGAWGYEYELSLSQTGILINNSIDPSYCEGKPRRVVGEQPLPVSAMGGDPVIIRLALCY